MEKIIKIKNIETRIVFFGTPDFSVASLESLISADFNIVTVITSLDNTRGKIESPVKKCALKHNIPVLQPVSMKSQDFIETLQSLNADIFVVVAFRMMPEIVWNMPPMGTINLHGSLLPKYRGAAPINWTIINGDKFTGNTTFKLKHEIDTGNILLQDKVSILETDNFGTLYEKMMHNGADLLVNTLVGLFSNTIIEQPQENIEISYAPKLFKDNTIINWNNTCEYLNNFIRGLSPYPSAYTLINNKYLKIITTHYVNESHNMEIGALNSDNKTYLRYACIDGWVYVDELQLEGKKRMNIKDLLNGFKF